MKKEDYLKGLKDAERVEAEVQRDEPKPEAPKAEAPKPEVPKAETPEVKPEPRVETPAIPELFPGFSALPAERQKEIADRWKLADEVEAAKAEAKRVAHELYLAQSRVGPTQQQLSKAQLEIARLSQQMAALKEQGQAGESSELKKRIEAIRENFPDDAAIFEATLRETEAAKQAALETRKDIEKLRRENYIARQLQELSLAHPDWQKKRIGVFVDEETGTRTFRRTVDTPDAQEMEVWANALDPYDREIIDRCIISENARDTIYALNRFERDRAVAKVLATQGQHATPPEKPTAPAPEAPVPDPDPSTRITAPAIKSAGQPMSDKKRAFLEAAEFLKKRQA